MLSTFLHRSRERGGVNMIFTYTRSIWGRKLKFGEAMVTSNESEIIYSEYSLIRQTV